MVSCECLGEAVLELVTLEGSLTDANRLRRRCVRWLKIFRSKLFMKTTIFRS